MEFLLFENIHHWKEYIIAMIQSEMFQYVFLAFVVILSFVNYLIWVRRPQCNLKNRDKLAIVITGCDTGFGNLSSKYFTKLGFKVISACLTEDGVKSLKNVVSLVVKVDVTKDKDVDKFAKVTKEFLEKNDIKLWAIVNNAGVATSGFLDWMGLDKFQFVMDVNYFGVLRTTKAFLQILKKTKNSRIITISSVAGLNGLPGFGPYSGSKHAIEGAMKCVRMELKPWNIHVANINPTFMNTPIISNGQASHIKNFEAAPTEIKEQYGETVPKDIPLTEDPMLVVYAIEKLIFDKYPVFNNYVGTLATISRIMNCFPFQIQELLGEFVIPPPKLNPEVVNKIQK